jgi:hypothetical protein
MKRQSGKTGQTIVKEALLAENTKSKPNSAVIILPILSMYFE